MNGRKPEADMTVESASWVWKNDQDGYDDWMNDLMRDAPESWDGDESAEWFVTEYIHTLEQRVVAAYGPEGLERHHEGVAHVIGALHQISAIRQWLTVQLPHVDLEPGVDLVTIRLLDYVGTVLSSLEPIAAQITQGAKKAGWLG